MARNISHDGGEWEGIGWGPVLSGTVARLIERDRKPVYLQIRHRRETLCGRLVEVAPANASRPDMFRCDTAIGPCWASSFNARLCSHDRRCTCAAGARGDSHAQRGEALGACGATPLGNTGTTVEARA